jgi:imidazolonepropionase-like amidohydrolase
MTKRGFTPIEAIRAAAISAADLIGWSCKVGALEHGMYADLICRGERSSRRYKSSPKNIIRDEGRQGDPK